MTHDPLCPNAKGCSHDCGGCLCLEDAFCQCDLIAQVRADERQRIIGVVERNSDGDAMKVIDAVLDMIFVPDHKNEYLNRDRGGTILGPILEHHPADPDKTRIMRDGKWVKP